MDSYTVTVTTGQLNLILQALAQCPYHLAAPVLQSLQQQVSAAHAEQAPPAPPAPGRRRKT